MNRHPWVSRHDPVLTGITPSSPLTVGNSRLAFTCDISGLQTLYADYLPATPLCTMADWGWHTIPAPVEKGRYTLDDVQMEPFNYCGRTVRYARTRYKGNEQVYDWLRQNPHKASLARVSLAINGAAPAAGDFSRIIQTLHLYDGIIESRYSLLGTPCRVLTACDPENDILAFQLGSELLLKGLCVEITFPYGSPDISGADWQNESGHQTRLDGHVILRDMDDIHYNIGIHAQDAVTEQISAHTIRVTAQGSQLKIALAFSSLRTPDTACRKPHPACHSSLPAPDTVLVRSRAWWKAYWEKGGMLDLSGSSDSRASELERRTVLSLYLLAINSAGSMPPAETGLTCNSWYGKAHLEMHFWHMAWAPLWGHSELLERSLPWYHAHLREARKNAARNGYRGARWPKMVADDCQNSPSPIAVLLVWQQPHIITLLELMRRAKQKESPAAVSGFMHDQWPLIRETADFMADYAVPDENGIYHIEPPVIPVQERYEPEKVRDPAFEAAYWRFSLDIAVHWARMLGITPPDNWLTVRDHMVPPPMHGGLYTAHINAPDTFAGHPDDHPSMLQCLGLLPGQDMDREAMMRTLDTVIRNWDFPSLWGWDFAVMAMTALRLGQREKALDLLLSASEKNTYASNGHNRQGDRSDLSLYLPGNGSLLIACAMLFAGWDGCSHSDTCQAGLPGWKAVQEGILPWF